MRVETNSVSSEQLWNKQNFVSTNPNAAPDKSEVAQLTKPAPEKEEQKSQEKAMIAEESLSELLKKAENELNFQLSFSIHKETNRVVVKVVDPESQKVLREIPPEEMLDLAAKIQEMLGILVDKRV